MKKILHNIMAGIISIAAVIVVLFFMSLVVIGSVILAPIRWVMGIIVGIMTVIMVIGGGGYLLYLKLTED